MFTEVKIVLQSLNKSRMKVIQGERTLDLLGTIHVCLQDQSVVEIGIIVEEWTTLSGLYNYVESTLHINTAAKCHTNRINTNISNSIGCNMFTPLYKCYSKSSLDVCIGLNRTPL